MNYLNMNPMYYKIGNRTIKIQKEHLDIVEAIHKGTYSNIKDIAKLTSHSAPTVSKIIHGYRLKEYYDEHKVTKTVLYTERLRNVLKNDKFSSFNDIGRICGLNYSHARNIIFDSDELTELYFRNVISDSAYIKIINTVIKKSYSTYHDIAHICGCSSSYVAYIVNKFNLKNIYKMNKIGRA